MPERMNIFKVEQRTDRLLTWGDVVAFAFVGVTLYLGVRLAFASPAVVRGPEISLSPRALPYYGMLSLRRMAGAYALSITFTLVYGRLAAYNRRAEQVLMPLLDVLQSVPILSFLPVVLLSLSAFLPVGLAAELASIVLIFTSQVWNLTFAWYQSLTTIPKELREASAIFRLNTWLRFKKLELPFAMISLVWNSMMSWAGGWFFLMAAEIFTVGQRDFRLPGLGAYLHETANQNDFQAIAWGIGALVALIVALDQFVWRPLLAWSDRFKVEMVESDQEPTSWFYDLLREAHFAAWLQHRIWRPAVEKLDVWMLRRFSSNQDQDETRPSRSWPVLVIGVTLGAGLFYGIYRSSLMLLVVPANQWIEIGAGLAATLLRVAAALTIALAWIVPAGVAIGTNRRLATLLQPPSRGQVFYRGKPLRGVNPYATIVFQTFALFPWLSVLENVELALQVKDIPPTWNQARRR